LIVEKIEKSNDLKISVSKKSKGTKRDSNNRIRLPKREKHDFFFIINARFLNGKLKFVTFWFTLPCTACYKD